MGERATVVGGGLAGAFVRALLDAEKVAPRTFEDVRYFEGCLPVELTAERALADLGPWLSRQAP